MIRSTGPRSHAFFQMLYETGNLGFGGDVRPAQNNFAGLGATGRGERGESFPTISAGVKAHLQHLLMYAGDVIEARFDRLGPVQVRFE